MNRIVVQKDFVYLYLNKNLYKKNIILSAIKKYDEFFKYEIKELGKFFTIKIKSIEEEYTDEFLAQEFANYLVGEIYNQKAF